ncbi:MAG: VOC family protein [Candidatus Methylomirabilales bacterium]
MPADARANDVFHWQVRLVDRQVEAAARLRAGGGRLVSPGVVTLPDRSLGFGRGLLARDPDGHAVQVVEGE